MRTNKYKYIFGPVYSWRLGSSLGIDPISTKDKKCSFNCVYCQVGNTTQLTDERKIFVSTEEIIAEVKTVPSLKIDYLTFTSRGEPTLAKNLGSMIRILREVRGEKIAVITNSALLHREDVQSDLRLVDCVLAKLDACSQETFLSVNHPIRGVKFRVIVDGIKSFRDHFSGKLALQIMFIDQNKKYAGEISEIARNIGVDEIQINTPRRVCDVKPLSKKELDRIKDCFQWLSVISIYDVESKNIEPFDVKETTRRHGKLKSSD